VSRTQRESLLIALAAAVAGLWLLPISSSLWIDEAGSWWVIRDGFLPTVERSIDATGQSPLYYVLLWAWTRVGGTTELALRAPSLIGAAIAALLLWRLGRKQIDGEAALLATIAFVTLGGFGSVAFSAADARPYALGLAFVVGSTLALVRWVDTPRARTAAVYALLLLGAIYTVYTYAIIALGHAIFLWLGTRRKTLPTRQIVVTALALGAALAPALAHLVTILRRPNIFESGSSIFSTSRLVTVAVIVFAAMVGFAFPSSSRRFRLPRSRPGTIPMLAGWAILPLAILLVLAILVAPKFFYARYYLAAMPGFALIVGWLLAGLTETGARITMALTIVALALITYAGPHHTPEDWRSAAAHIKATDQSALVLLRSGFAGSKPDRLADPQVIGLVRSPLDYYHVERDIELLPFRLDNDAGAHIDALLARRLDERVTVVLVTRAPFLGIDGFVDERLHMEGFRSTTALEGAVRVVIYRRS